MSGDINHAEREHSSLSASGVYIWGNCPASVRLSRGIERKSSAASNEGTAAHELAELAINGRQDCIECVGRVVNGYTVDAEMAEYVQLYVDEVNRLRDECLPDSVWTERRIRLDNLLPPEPMFGTLDFGAFVTGHHTLYIRDLKYGKGHYVPAQDNPQLKYYALGLLFALADDPKFGCMPPKYVDIGIVQPRPPASRGNPVRSHRMLAEEVYAWAGELLAKAEATQAPDAPAIAGEHCFFCPAAATCAANAKHALAVVQSEFGNVDLPYTPPAAETLSSADLARAYTLAPQFEAWLRTVKAEVTARALAGDTDIGHKVIQKEGNAAWLDAAAAGVELSLSIGVDPYATPAIVSPAQARARIADAIRGQHKTKKAATEAAKAILAPLTHKPLHTALVPAADPRPAIVGGGAEFPMLADETEDKE